MEKGMMKKFFMYLVLSLLVKGGCAEVTINPAEGVEENPQYNFTMEENNHSFKDKTAIFKVYGAQNQPMITFAATSASFVLVLQQENNSYVLYSNQSFDYEQNQRLYRLNFVVGTFVKTLTLNIKNIDDEPPTLSSPQCDLNENTVYNLKNSSCSCILTDPDGWLSKTTFNITSDSSGTEPDIFDIGFKEKPDDLEQQAYVFIYLKGGKQLDYETISFYMFYIIAKDSANHSTTPEKVLAIINVGDMRDTPPVWTGMIAFEQFEEQQKMTFTVSARDGDVGINKNISYRVNSQDDTEAQYVSIDKQKGIIHVAPIDRDKNDILMYGFEIAAYVSDEEIWNTSQYISFYIIDIDNKPPLVEWIIDQKKQKIIFNETTDNSTSLSFLENYAGNLNISISMRDKDTGENAQFTVELEKLGNKIDHTKAFMIVPNIGYKNGTFMITVSNASYLDYEDKDWRNIKFNVLATGVLNKTKQYRMSVNIDLIDYNDEKPIFAQDEYSVTINETAKNGEFITTVLATDRDEEDKILNHALVASSHTSEILRIEPATGKIYVNSTNAFDYDTINPVFVQVKATDKVGHTATVPLTINLKDVNNKAPSISSGDPISVEENQEDGTILKSKITASDMDTNANLTVEINWEMTYALKNSRRLDMTDETLRKQVEFLNLSCSNIGSRNIEITLVVNNATDAIPAPDFELFDSLYLTLNVTDLNTDPEFLDKKNASAIILISIIDINDNIPIFQDITVDNRTVEENADAKTSVGTIKAIDLDVTDTVTYSCNPEDPNFDWLDLDVNKGTFTVKANGLIDADTNQTWTFNYTCTASDNNMTHTSEPVRVPFYILDRNNKRPDISLNSTISLIEKPDDDQEVVTIGYHDADRDIPFHTVVCQFPDAQEVCSQKFYISNNTVKVKFGKVIDRDSEEKSFNCSINCEDNQIRWRSEGVLSTPKSFTIVLKDRNDNTPELDMGNITTSENKTKDETIAMIVAKDIDEGANADIDFNLTSVIKNGTKEEKTSLFALRTMDDYVISLTHKQAHLIAKDSLKGHYGKYIINMVLSDKGEVPNINLVNRTLTIKKFNFEPPFIIFPNEQSTFTLLSVQQQNSPLAIFRSTEHLEDFSASDGEKTKTCQKWDMSFSLTQLSPATASIFKLVKKGNCIYQLQINDKFNSDDVLGVEQYKLQIRVQINTDNDDLWDDKAADAPYFSVRNITIKFADNAQMPYFNYSTLSLKAEEGNVSQVLNLTGKAVYDNSDETMPIHYFMITENNTIKNIFKVDENTGDIMIMKKFYYDYDKEFQFQILASNDSNPSSSKPNSHLDVTVEVLPANLRPPEFVSEYFFGAILPGFIVDTPIITAEAKDPDFVDQNTLEYWIKDNKIDVIGSGLKNLPNPAFEVEPTTGRVILKFSVENTMSGYFSFDICVRDNPDQFGNGPHNVSTKVTIFIITEDKTVDFRFYNNITEVQDNEEQMLKIMTDVIGIQAYRQSFQNQSSDDGLLTIARLYFINSTINAGYQAGSSVMAVDSEEIMSLVSQYGTYNKLQTELRAFKLILVPFPASESDDSSQLQAWLIGTSAVLGALCVLLLGILIFKIRQLNRRISNLTARKFGSQESGMNRLGIAAPTTNKHAIEGSNPIFNAEDMNIKKSKDMADFETRSIRSGDSDLIGVEDNPEFDYAFNQTDEKTTYL